MDSLTLFVQEKCTFDPRLISRSFPFYYAYEAYCRQHNKIKSSFEDFDSTLKKTFETCILRHTHCYKGLALTHDPASWDGPIDPFFKSVVGRAPMPVFKCKEPNYEQYCALRTWLNIDDILCNAYLAKSRHIGRRNVVICRQNLFSKTNSSIQKEFPLFEKQFMAR